MTIALASKPGLSSNTTLHIPKDWDPVWFRNLISNQLKGADVRNAVGANGIVVSGNISSPYATIGFAAPITLPGPVTITGAATGTPLTINSPSSSSIVTLNSTAVTGPYIEFMQASTPTGYFGTAGAAGSLIVDSSAGDTVVQTAGHNFRVSVNNGASTAFRVSTTGGVIIAAPTTAITNALSVTGVASATAIVASAAVGGFAFAAIGTAAGTPVVVFNTQATTGAQTASFTATNKPGAAAQTTPSTWLPVTVDGVTKYIPCFS